MMPVRTWMQYFSNMDAVFYFNIVELSDNDNNNNINENFPSTTVDQSLFPDPKVVTESAD